MYIKNIEEKVFDFAHSTSLHYISKSQKKFLGPPLTKSWIRYWLQGFMFSFKLFHCSWFIVNPISRYVSIEFFTIGVSVRLSDRSLYREEQKKIRQKLPPVGLKPGPLDLQANVLPTELGRNLLGRKFLKWALFHAPLHMLDLGLFLESIEHDFIKPWRSRLATIC